MVRAGLLLRYLLRFLRVRLHDLLQFGLVVGLVTASVMKRRMNALATACAVQILCVDKRTLWKNASETTLGRVRPPRSALALPKAQIFAQMNLLCELEQRVLADKARAADAGQIALGASA